MGSAMSFNPGGDLVTRVESASHLSFPTPLLWSPYAKC